MVKCFSAFRAADCEIYNGAAPIMKNVAVAFVFLEEIHVIGSGSFFGVREEHRKLFCALTVDIY